MIGRRKPRPQVEHAGYAFTDTDDSRVVVPALTRCEAADYINVPMSERKALAVCSAYLKAASRSRTPITPVKHGAGYDAVIPMEVIAQIPLVAEWLRRHGY